MTPSFASNDVTIVEEFNNRRRERTFNGTSIEEDSEEDNLTTLEVVLQLISIIVLIVTFPFSLIFTVRIVNEFERLVLFRFGRITRNSPKGPGFHILLPFIDYSSKVDLRIYNFIVPIKEIVLKDSVCITIEAVVWARVSSVISAVTSTEDYYHTSKMYSASVVRKILGAHTLADVVNDSKYLISKIICSQINDVTRKIGVTVQRIDLKNISLPEQLQRVMAREGIATRESKAMTLFADGERASAGHLTHAGGNLNQTALSLRYMQTLNSIQGNTDQGSTLFFPVPIDFGWTTWNKLKGFDKKKVTLASGKTLEYKETLKEKDDKFIISDIDPTIFDAIPSVVGDEISHQDDDLCTTFLNDVISKSSSSSVTSINNNKKEKKRKPRSDHEYFDIDVTIHEVPPQST